NGNQLAITDGAGVEIRGPGAELLTIDANRQSRVLYIATDAEASIDGVTFTNGLTPDYGGGIYNHGVLELIDVDILANEAGIGGGGIWSNDTVNLTGATIVGNSADNGGGIHNWGSASVTDSTIDDNAAIQGGGILNENYASLSVGNSSVSNNTAARGAAAYNDVGGELSIDGSALSDNSATDDGGAVYNAGSLLSLLDSTISRNSAGDNGGALFTIAGTTTVTASLIANNVATDFGGGVFSSGTVSITISTIAGNVADLGGGVYVNLGSTTAWNSIIAENYAPASPNLHGSLQSESDYNLVDVDPGFVRAPSAGADGIWGNTDDDKGDLHLRSTSVAINQGSSVVVPDAEAISVETDLDGKPRIIYDVVDIGVYEFALVADANYDATVDQGDSQVLASHWGMTGMTWNEGDFDLDGIVGPKDAALLGANWGATFTPPVSGSQPIADTGLAACPTLVGPLQANGPIAARRPLEPVIRKSLLSHKQPASVLESLPAAHDAALVEAFDPVAEQTVPQRLAWSFAMSRGSGDSEQDKLLDLHDAALDELLLNDVS
ncbi:MAG: hypothetical protein JW888_16015, partial [Pirellulales bacterium]|nr:hypothetical protein [Pirellulales bacterium]